MYFQKIVLLIILAIVAECHCVFHNLLSRLIPGGQDEYQTKLIPLGRFRLNLANYDDSNLNIIPATGRGPYTQPVISLFLRTVQPIQRPTPRERIRTFFQGLNPFNRQPRPTSTNNGFDNSFRNVAVTNLGSNQWNPIILGRVNQNDSPKFNQGYVMNSGTRNNWGTSQADPGDLKILGPNFKILLNQPNQQAIQDIRNARHISKSNYDKSTKDLINSFKSSSSFGMASEYVNPTYGNHLYRNAENSYSNYENSDTFKTDTENNLNSDVKFTQDENYSDVINSSSSSLNPPGLHYNNPEPITYMAPPPLQLNNNMYYYNPNYESGYSSNGPNYSTRFNSNPIQDHIWSNQYDNPFNQPYPNFYRYAGWNHRADSVGLEKQQYTIPSKNMDKLTKKSDVQIESNDEKMTRDKETSSDEIMVTGEELSSLKNVEKKSNDLSDKLESSEIHDEEIPFF